MRIGIDARLWNESGVGRYTRNLVQNLTILDKKNQYVLFLGGKEFESLSFPDNFKKVRADLHWHTLSEQLKFPTIINRENLDLMHFPYFSVPIFYNRAYVVTIHDLILHHFPTGQASTHSPMVYGAKLLFYRYIVNRAAQKSKKIITVSRATKREIVEDLKTDENKIVVTYEGIEDDLKDNGDAPLYKDYFLYVGNAYPHKNLDRLLDAFDVFIKTNGKISLVLVGKEDFFYKRLKQRVSDKGMDKRVKFFGEASNKDLANLYSHALGLVMPSLMEGFGLPALEAMANGCLILASDIPSLKEICLDSAMYFNPHDTDSLTKSLKLALRAKKTKAKMIKKGLARVQYFSWEKMAKETLKIYESCIGL